MAGPCEPVVGVVQAAGVIVSVNGDTGPAVVLDASDIPSTGPSTVQADLDALKYIESAANLETRFPAAGGVHTIDIGAEFRMPVGATDIDIGANQIEYVHPGGAVGIGAQVVIRSSAAGPVFFGETNITNMAAQHTNVAGSCLQAESLAGRTLRMTDVELIGTDPGTISNSVGGTVIKTMVLIPTAPGALPLRLSGAFGAAIISGVGGFAPGTADYTAIEITSAASITGTITFTDCFLQSMRAGDRLFNFDSGLTIPATNILSVTGSQVLGPGEMFDAAGLTEASVEIVAVGLIDAADSLWLGDVSFIDTVTPIVLVHSGSPEVMPSENAGPTTVITENAINQRFVLAITGLQVWEVAGTARSDKLTGSVSWSASVARSGGGIVRPFTCVVEVDDQLGGGFVSIPETAGAIEMAGATPASFGGSAPIQFDKDYAFRLVVTGNIGTATAISQYRLTTTGR